MKRTAMKNTIFIISVIVLCIALACCMLGILLLPMKIAYAESTQDVVYAPVSDLENNEYAGASTLKLIHSKGEIYIPESYYVSNISAPITIDDKGTLMYSVLYCGEIFYIKTETSIQPTTITFQDDVSPFPNVTLILKEDALLFIDNVEITSDYTIKLLGYGANDPNLVFVSAIYNGDKHFGFITIDNLEPFVVPYHPIAQAERDAILASKYQPDPDNGDIVPNTSLSLRIILIIGICVPALIIAFLLFKPSGNDRTQGKNTLRKSRKRDEFDYDSSRTYSSDRQNGYDDGYDRGYSRGYNDARSNNRDPRDYDDRDRYDNNYDNRDNRGGYDNRDWR